ncbi:hypothetical protein [uncultured Winogradskyella sp.]|uniref:hypothetical protein n=1 Tax=uncultured Winogradskyella sp. TaxID=395353 RepID=UPI0030DD0C5F
MKILNFFQYAYLIFAVMFIWKATSIWSEDRGRSYLMLFLAALALFMFFFRKRFKKKIEDSNKQ